MKYFYRFLFGLSAFFFSNSSFSQPQKIDSVLSVYSQIFQPEKIHIHFDKYIYNKGETIWFKAYLLTGTDISDISKNLYVDFFDVTGKLLKHFITPISQASAKGQFNIPTNYTGSVIHINAYTQWMLNFDSSFHFKKDIVVVQSKPAKVLSTEQNTSIQFFPEGGDLIEGLNSKIAFLAVNQLGKPVDVKGSIVTNKGEFVDSFKSQHDGMGSFNIEVKPGETYTVKWKDAKGKLYTGALPAIQKQGVNLTIKPFARKTIVGVSRTNNVEETLKMVYIVAQMNQQLVYRSKLNLLVKTSGYAEIPTENLPTGVLQITVFNAQLVPLAERVVFVNNHNHEFITDVGIAVKNLNRKGKNIIQIYSPDTIPTNLSVSITDGDLTTEKNNIISQFLLCDDIKGYIHNPSYYFDSEEDSVQQNLDLVMLTHGWRRFNWKDVLNGTGTSTHYARDSDYIQIKGKTFSASNMKLPLGQKIILILKGKDSTKQSLVIPVAQDGSFVLRGAVFFDTMQVYYKFLGDKIIEGGSELTFQNGFLPARQNAISNGSTSAYLWTIADSTQTERLKYFAQKQAELEKLMKTTTLADVVVQSKVKSQIEILDQKYTSGMFGGGDAYQYDVINDTRAQSMYSVFQYLQGMVPGLQITQGGGQGWQLSWRGGTPELFLDEVRSDVSMVENMPMSDVAYVKVFRPPFFGAIGGGSGGAIAIYTRKGGDTKPTATKGGGLSYKLLEGYSAYKQFYSPDYSGAAQNFTPDTRTTLYWQPYILTDGHNRKAKIEFYNNDISKRLRVIIEGVNADGKLTRTEKMIE
jgi:hypothetical protein